MGSTSRVIASAMVALLTLSSIVAQDPRSNQPTPAPGATPAPGLFGFTFPSFNIPTLGPIGVPCLGASSLSSGVCRKDDGECSATGGAIDGQCLGNFGQCCVPTIECGATALTNGSFLSNNNYPKETTENTQCTITITKVGNIKQIRLELIKFHVGAPDAQGKCSDDFMMIQSGLSAGASIPRLCGKNDGQHIILPVEETKANKELTVVIRFSISGRSKSMWLIQVIQQHQINPMIAPDNCLQYHTGPTGNMSSLSTGANLDGLRYSICFRKEIDFCSIKFNFKPSTVETGDNATTSDNSTTAEARKRREAHGNYGPGQYAAPLAAPQQHVQYPPQYARPVQNIVQRPVQQGHYQYGKQIPVSHPVKPVVGYRPPYHPHPLFPSTGKMNATESSIPTTSGNSTVTDATTDATNSTDTSVTDRNVPVDGSTPSTPALNCDGQDIVTFPPATIVCANNMAIVTPIIIDTSRLIVFVDNRSLPPHQTGWSYDYSYQSC